MSCYRLCCSVALIGVMSVWANEVCADTRKSMMLTPTVNAHFNTLSTPMMVPASLETDINNSYKIAGICFMGFGDCGGNIGLSNINDNGDDFALPDCASIGYTLTNCTPPGYPDKFCPYDSNYFSSCRQDAPKACTAAGYVQKCDNGEILNPDSLCPYESSFGNCICNPCSGYDYTYEEATAKGYETDGLPCDSCGTKKYKRKAAECNGYLVCDCGPEIGSPSCWSGTLELFETCQECCAHKCTLDECPDGMVCTLEECSEKFCATGCATGLTDAESYWCNGALWYWLPQPASCQ